MSEVRMIFQDEDLASDFVAWWLDGGGEQGMWADIDNGPFHVNSEDWDKESPVKWIKVVRTDSRADI